MPRVPATCIRFPPSYGSRVELLGRAFERAESALNAAGAGREDDGDRDAVVALERDEVPHQGDHVGCEQRVEGAVVDAQRLAGGPPRRQ